jgi:hypothetical protein
MSTFSNSLNKNLQHKTQGMGLKGVIGGNKNAENLLEAEVPESKEKHIEVVEPKLVTEKKINQKSIKEELKRLPVDLPMKLYEKLAIKKVRVKLSMREMIIHALEIYLEK